MAFASKFLKVFTELIKFDIVLLTLLIILLAGVMGVISLLRADLIEIDGGLLTHRFQGLFHILDTAVFFLKSILLRCVLPALQDRRIIMLRVALVCDKGILVLVDFDPSFILFLNILHQ